MDKISFRTPEALGSSSYANLDDSKTNFQSMKCNRKPTSSAFLWKPDTTNVAPIKGKQSQHCSDESRKALFAQPYPSGSYINDENSN